MKAGAFAISVMVLVVALVSINSFVLDRSIAGFIMDVQGLSVYDDDAYEDAEKIKKKFKEAEGLISLTVNHDDLTNIEECYSDLTGYLKAGMSDEAEVTKSRLIDALAHLRRLSGVNIDSII